MIKKISDKRTALVTGGNRGLGLETCRQLSKLGYNVILASRDAKAGARAAQTLRKDGLNVTALHLDVTRDAHVKRALTFIKKKFKRLDVLVNNAGVFLDSEKSSTMKTKLKTIRETLEVNTIAPFHLCQTFAPLMVRQGYGRIVNLSSGMGQLHDMNAGSPAYRISKTAINAVTKIFAEETKGTDVLVNSVCPGWVKTRMGGQGAELAPEQGVETIVWLATLPAGGPTGGFFREKARIEW